MKSLSLAMIVRNEEGTLARVLNCVRHLCDELIIVDTGSQDSTATIARNLGARVHEFSWRDDFAAARNRSFELCRGDWILWLDADDFIPSDSVSKLQELRNALASEEVDAIGMPYCLSFDPSGQCTYSLYRNRLFRRGANPRWQYPVHEFVWIEPERTRCVHHIFIEHRPTAERLAAKEPEAYLSIVERAISSGDRSEHILFSCGNELRKLKRYADAIAAFEEFLERPVHGWRTYYAMKWISRCYRELDNKDQALNWAVSATKQDPNRAECFNDAGLILYTENRFAEAVPFFLAAVLQSQPEDGSPVEHWQYGPLPLDYLSSCYMALGEYSKAYEFGQRAIKANPSDARLLSNLAVLSKLSGLH